jgi:hypothetical protein
MRTNDKLALSYLSVLRTLTPPAERPAYLCAPVVELTVQGSITIAQVLVLTPAGVECGLGAAKRHPRDKPNPEYGERLAIWRACKTLLGGKAYV